MSVIPTGQTPVPPVRMLLAFLLGAISLLSTHLHFGVLGKTALEKNRGRLLNPIQVVNFPQDACVVNVGGLDTTGVCLSGSECNARDGIIIGQFLPISKICDTISIHPRQLCSRIWCMLHNPGGRLHQQQLPEEPHLHRQPKLSKHLLILLCHLQVHAIKGVIAIS